MDHYQEDSKSDEDSITLEIQGSDAVIMYGCNENRRPTYVTTVLLGPGVSSSSVDGNTVMNNSAPVEHCTIQTKPYNELAETVARIGGKSFENSSIPVPPDLTREFQNSARYLDPPTKSNTDPNIALAADGSLELPHVSNIVGNAPSAVNQQPMSLTVIAVNTDPPEPTQPPDLLGHATRATIAEPQPSVTDETVPKDTVSRCSSSNRKTSLKVTESPTDVHSSSPADDAAEINARNAQNCPEPARIQIINACPQEIPTQQSAKTESSFHVPDPQKPKEVKFDEPPKQVVLTLEEFSEKLGEIVPITIQRGQNATKIIEPDVTPLPTDSAKQCKSKDEPGDRHTTSNPANGNTKTNNSRDQEAESSGELEEQEHSYGIIGNEDNMSEITLPPVHDSSIHQNHDVGPLNGHPCHRIRISIDQQSASPSRKTMAITGVIVVLLLLAAILFGVYKFFHKRPSE